MTAWPGDDDDTMNGDARFADSTIVEFASGHDRSNLMGLGGDPDARARLFSYGDEVLPRRKLHAAGRPDVS